MQAPGQSCRRLSGVFVDADNAREGVPDWVRTTFGWILLTVLRPSTAKGFVILPKRRDPRTHLGMVNAL